MSSSSEVARLNAWSLEWLRKSVLPRWTTAGFDATSGMFEESLKPDATPGGEPRRAMVQARQIYSLRMAFDMGLLSRSAAVELIEPAARNLIAKFQLPSGAFIHSLHVDGFPADERADLYTQSFAIFGLAHAYAVVRDENFRATSLRVLSYLRSERAFNDGGYIEFGSGNVSTRASNPHMHLFEAALAWMDIDPSSQWREFSDELATLALKKLIDPSTGFLAENFVEGWKPEMIEGRFIFEPGHQYEWAWLLSRYSRLTGVDCAAACDRMYLQSEECGVDRASHAVFDQVWSDRSVALRTSRFWPHTERIKAAVGRALAGDSRAVAAACEAFVALQKYLATPVQGLWYDRMNPDGSFTPGNAKGSSLYHIIGALVEFNRLAGGRS